MKASLIALAAVAALLTVPAIFAQEAPLRGAGLLALASAGDSRSGIGRARDTLVEIPASGGGGTRDVRGSDGRGTTRAPQPAAATPDALPPRTMQGDPAVSPVETPKRPSYRWQSLVPGAIK